MRALRPTTRVRRMTVFILGVVVGSVLVVPAGAHVSRSFTHLWGDHIKPRADARYVESQQVLWAYVEADGSLRNGRGATGAQLEEATSQYVVEFSRDVAECAWIATRSTARESSGEIAASGGNDPNTVVVDIHNSTGFEGDSVPFSLAVFCGTT